ncbi:MAG TPA: hypothetical protein VIT90_10990 [Lysobacter sp.]
MAPFRMVLPAFVALSLLGACSKAPEPPISSVPAAPAEPAGPAGPAVPAAPAAAAAATPAPAAPATDAPAPDSTAAAAPAAPAAPDAKTAAPAETEAAAINEVNASIDSSLGDHGRYEPLIHDFQAAVVNADKDAVARMVHYPFGATIDGKTRVIKDPAGFVASYDRIFTPDIVKVVREQKYGDLFVNYKGIMFGSGQVWINGICAKNSRNCEQFEAKVVTIQHGP